MSNMFDNCILISFMSDIIKFNKVINHSRKSSYSDNLEEIMDMDDEFEENEDNDDYNFEDNEENNDD